LGTIQYTKQRGREAKRERGKEKAYTEITEDAEFTEKRGDRRGGAGRMFTTEDTESTEKRKAREGGWGTQGRGTGVTEMGGGRKGK